jgi:hypothetical protein
MNESLGGRVVDADERRETRDDEEEADPGNGAQRTDPARSRSPAACNAQVAESNPAGGQRERAHDTGPGGKRGHRQIERSCMPGACDQRGLKHPEGDACHHGEAGERAHPAQLV